MTNTGTGDARNVVIATGQDNEAALPDWPGKETFTGDLIHSGQFGDVRDCSGRRILLVGAGNSSVDIANHLSTVDTDELATRAAARAGEFTEREREQFADLLSRDA